MGAPNGVSIGKASVKLSVTAYKNAVQTLGLSGLALPGTSYYEARTRQSPPC